MQECSHCNYITYLNSLKCPRCGYFVSIDEYYVGHKFIGGKSGGARTILTRWDYIPPVRSPIHPNFVLKPYRGYRVVQFV